jgi:hypothetical protein
MTTTLMDGTTKGCVALLKDVCARRIKDRDPSEMLATVA